MSTRCQIDFIAKWKDDKGKLHVEKRRVYRHSDGYPESVIPALKAFLKWLTSEPQPRPFGDVEYTAANFIYWSKKRLFDWVTSGPKKDGKYLKGWEKLGFGVCSSDFHRDIEYFYEVIECKRRITVRVYKTGCPARRKNFKLIRTVRLQGVR
jgi:hypothetical protein